MGLSRLRDDLCCCCANTNSIDILIMNFSIVVMYETYKSIPNKHREIGTSFIEMDIKEFYISISEVNVPFPTRVDHDSKRSIRHIGKMLADYAIVCNRKLK